MIPGIDQYLSPETVEALVKVATQERADHPAVRGLKTMGLSLGGMALGAGAGLGIGYGAEKLLGKKLPGKYLKYTVPAAGILGMGAGLAEAAMREKQMQEMRDAIKKYKAKSRNSR